MATSLGEGLWSKFDSEIDRTVISPLSNEKFLRHGKVQEIFTTEAIEQVLRETNKDFRDSGLAKYIADHAPRVFAILVSIELIDKAFLIEKFHFMDKYLPVQRENDRITTFHLLADDLALRWFDNWGKRELARFEMHQWRFTAVVFTGHSILEQPHDKCPLPFKSYQSTNREGSFGKIYKAEVYSDHIKDSPNDEQTTVAIKELHDANISDRAYELEVDALELVRGLNHEHLVEFIAGYEVKGKHYLMFQWVDGGNLRNHWHTSPWSLDENSIIWALEQMKGIAGGLEALHGFDTQRNCRHGDLKPENILVFDRPGESKILQIADMGSAKIHSIPTNLRQVGTVSLAGTIRYQPPEVKTSLSGKRSRAYDIWSMGCILLELIIWILFGKDGLNEFDKSFDNMTQPFFHVNQESETLHPNVKNWIEHLRKTCLDDSSNTCVSQALRDLLDFVHEQMLVENDEVEIGAILDSLERKNSSNTELPSIILQRATTRVLKKGQERRADISTVKEKLKEILLKAGNPGYIYNDEAAGHGNSNISLPDTTQMNRLDPERMMKTHQPARQSQQNSALPHTWEVCNDNIFARDFFRTLDSTILKNDFAETLKDEKQVVTPLCENCRKIFQNHFSYTIAHTSKNCGLCQVLKSGLERVIHKLNEDAKRNAKFVRVGSSLTIDSTAAPKFSILVGSGYSDIPSHIQRGFPYLPEPRSATRARLLNSWIRDCEDNHGETCKAPNGPKRLPTRLIYVGNNSLKLDCNPKENSRYITLSHPWGLGKDHPPFCTKKSNIKEYEQSIELHAMPRNFQDAVTVTRSLNIDYLWIDSLCIMQKEGNDKGDFDTESKFMEEYYSGAYCTIAATSSKGSSSGFLDRIGRTARECHKLISDSGTAFHICNSIDNFARDVEESNLSKRGWVFQERALSRRTIHFAGTQVYWECGRGVRCETMTRLFNRRSSFISDPSFPNCAAKYYKGMKIEFFQHIYSTYSALDFTWETDRSVAMFGLEKRLANVYRVHARYGILCGEYLHRSLLWQAEDEKKGLRKIEYGNGKKIPSWSWMAVTGTIKYMRPPFDMMEWEGSIKSPFKGPLPNTGETYEPEDCDLIVPVLDVLDEANAESLVYDQPDCEANKSRGKPIIREGLKCVVIGRERIATPSDPSDYFVLLVIPTGHKCEEYEDYERIGVARLTSTDMSGTPKTGRIV